MMDSKSYRTYANFLKSLSLKLTRFYYKKLDKNFVVYYKLKGKGNDPVTTSDRAFEKFIRNEIRKRFPTHQIIGEEFGKSKNKSETNSNWLKRPLSDDQMKYASEDVNYLIEIFKAQKKILMTCVHLCNLQ